MEWSTWFAVLVQREGHGAIGGSSMAAFDGGDVCGFDSQPRRAEQVVVEPSTLDSAPLTALSHHVIPRQ